MIVVHGEKITLPAQHDHVVRCLILLVPVLVVDRHRLESPPLFAATSVAGPVRADLGAPLLPLVLVKPVHPIAAEVLVNGVPGGQPAVADLDPLQGAAPEGGKEPCAGTGRIFGRLCYCNAILNRWIEFSHSTPI